MKEKMEIPKHLDHKPICYMAYDEYDGKWANDTDARFISIGLSQWDIEDISIKILRHTGQKWSRQSEELPLHRIADMAIFLVSALFKRTETIEAGTFENQKDPLKISCLEQHGYQLSNLDAFKQTRLKDMEIIKNRLRSLKKIINSIEDI